MAWNTDKLDEQGKKMNLKTTSWTLEEVVDSNRHRRKLGTYEDQCKAKEEEEENVISCRLI